MSLREKILAVKDEKKDSVPCPEWGVDVPIRSLTAHQMERWWDILNDHAEKGIDPPGGRKASVVMMGCVDENGEDLFKAEDIEVLGKKHPVVISRLFKAIQEISGITQTAAVSAEKKQPEPTNSSSIGCVNVPESST